MEQVPKFTIATPLIIICLAIVFRLAGMTRSYYSNRTYVVSPTPTFTPQQTNPFESLMNPGAAKNNPLKLDLQGPSVCTYSSTTASAEAYIKNKQVFADVKDNEIQSSYLIAGDCAYIWQKENQTGKKYCGVSSYIGTLEMLLSTPFFSNSLLTEAIANNSSIPLDSSTIIKMLQSCKKNDVEDSRFVVPKNVNFTEEKLDTSSLGL